MPDKKKKWKEKEYQSKKATEWLRSWRQTIECSPGVSPVLTAHLQIVRRYEDDRFESMDSGALTIRMDSLSGSRLEKAQKIQELMTDIIQEIEEENNKGKFN